MSDQIALREAVRQAIRAGRLPGRLPNRAWGGPGSGASCPICRREVTANELEFEIELVAGGEGQRPNNVHVHLSCFWVWKAVCEDLAAEPGAVTTRTLSGATGEARFGADERETPGKRAPA